MLGFIGFVAYGSYLVATRTNYGLNGGPGIVAGACLGAIAGYVLTDSERDGNRSAEFLVLLVLFLFAFSAVTALGLPVLRAIGGSRPGVPSTFVAPFVSVVLALCASGYLAYGRRTAFYRRFVGG